MGRGRPGLDGQVQRPIGGWLGRKNSVVLAPGYAPADGIRSVVSGTPPILGMLPVRDGVELTVEAGIEAIRAKSLLLTGFAIEIIDSWPAGLGIRVASPRNGSQRGGHVAIARPDFGELMPVLHAQGVIPDFRAPDGIRIGLAPLSTSFVEVYDAMQVIRSVVGG